MNKADTYISYRPDLVNILKKGINNIITLYETNQKAVLYTLLSQYFYSKNEIETGDLLNNASKLLIDNTLSSEETFYYNYVDKISKIKIEEIDDLGTITQASSFRFLTLMYKKFLDDLKNSIDDTEFSKIEKYMINHIFYIIESPLRNPNIQVKDGQTKCYYDKNPGITFTDSMKFSINYINKNINSILSIWNEE